MIAPPVSLCGHDVDEFIAHYFPTAASTLFIGNVGFSPDVLYFPFLLNDHAKVDFKFLFEQRPGVPAEINAIAQERRKDLERRLGESLTVSDVSIIAADGAAVAGRNACMQVDQWLREKSYSDIVVDATGMSRGTCFPIVKLLRQRAMSSNTRVHLLIADNAKSRGFVSSISNDRADWLHGYTSNVENDELAKALKLWVVQLSENHGGSLQIMFKDLNTPDEVCPIVPFPSDNPRRGDDLLFELRNNWIDEWGETPLNLIHAHESDPIDVYRTIVRLHNSRLQALEDASLQSITILSPIGRRLPSIGMMLAALDYDLPILYLETVGYEVKGSLPAATEGAPLHRWHFRLDERANHS